jgi:hypothetical protein
VEFRVAQLKLVFLGEADRLPDATLSLVRGLDLCEMRRACISLYRVD